jgi:hypothetical protein
VGEFEVATGGGIWVAIGAVTFDPKATKGFNQRASAFAHHRTALGFSLPSHYKRVSATVAARGPYEAAEKALNAIDLIRASWNLSINRGKGWRHSSGRPSPVNDIRLSPFHTVHQISGALATDTYWYDPSFAKAASLYSDKPRFLRLQEFARKLRLRLVAHPYRRDVEAALVRYVRALDSPDLNDSFLRLWSLLEYLTDSGRDPYKVAIRRTSFLFQDHERARLVLMRLTEHRNRFVHAGSDSQEIEALVFLLKRHVDTLLLFHIESAGRFPLRSEAAKFLDLPSSKSEIDVRLKRLRYARRLATE